MRRVLSVLGLLLVFGGCGDAEVAVEIDEAKAWETLDLGMTPAEFEDKLGLLTDVPIDPKPVVGKDYDPVFPDPIPFDPAEWTTNKPSPSVADPRAKKGGKLRSSIIAWPATIRTEGPNSRSSFLFTIHQFCYETLLGYDATQKEFVPDLATHWQISDDRLTFRFRMDPRARWADGREVTADDVVASLEHLKNPDRKDPGVARRWNETVEYAKVLDKLTVEIKCKEARWRAFLSVANGILIFPAAYIRMDGDTYINDWNWKLPPGSGPYELRPEDIRKPRSITLRRRKDWWAKDKPEYRGMFNFDAIEWQKVSDEELRYQKFLAGELDTYLVTRAQRWVEELDKVDVISKGWVQRRRIFNKSPEGFGGFCMNMRRPPFNDRRNRLAFSHLMNRERLFSSFFFYQYEYTDSYFPGSEFARPNAERIRYDPEKARALLAEAGWIRKDDEGYLVNAKGERFPVLDFEFSTSSFQRIHDVFKNDLWNEAGIKMNLKLVNRGTLSKKMWEYKFDLFWINWTASLFPTLELTYLSDNADIAQTNNLSGLKIEEMDRIIKAYRVEFDAKKRVKMLQRADEILFDAVPYALAWYSPYFRVIYWDRFGHPPEYGARFTSDERNIMYYWWFDEEKDARLRENMRNKRPGYPDKPGHDKGQYGTTDQKYWLYNTHPMKDE